MNCRTCPYDLVSPQKCSCVVKETTLWRNSASGGIRRSRMSKRKGQAFTLSFLVFALILPIPATHASPKPNRQPKVHMTMFGTATMPDGASITHHGFLFNPGFFEKLEPKNAGDEIVFQREGKIVEFFPGEMQFKLFVTGLPDFDNKTHGRMDPNLSAESLSALRFFGFWKNGLDMRPVESLSLLTLSVEEREPIPFLLWPAAMQTYQVWVFEFRLRARAVPVTDHFILTIETPTNERLARLSAHLRN
jgi:hypothetical protein